MHQMRAPEPVPHSTGQPPGGTSLSVRILEGSQRHLQQLRDRLAGCKERLGARSCLENLPEDSRG